MKKFDESDYEFFEIAQLSDIPNGKRIFVEVDGDPIVVFNIGGEFFATDDLCTHDDGPLGEGKLNDYKIMCPRHGAEFDVRTGEVVTLPANENIEVYPVRIVGEMIEIGLPL